MWGVSLTTLSVIGLVLLPLEEINGHSYERPIWQVDDRCSTRRILVEETQEELLNDNNSKSFKKEEQHLSTVKNNLRSQLQPPTLLNNATKNEEESAVEERLLDEFIVQEVLGPFHLKLYWEPWYCWQEEMVERKWCMECEGQTCEYGDKLQVQVCDECDVAQQFDYVPSLSYSGGQIRVATDNGDYGVDTSKGSLCWTRFSGKAHRLEECRDADSKQVYGGFLQDDEQRFTIIPQYDSSKCMTQHHHPKPFENVYAEDCISSDNTRWWERYWEEDDDGNYINYNHYDQTDSSTHNWNNEVCGTVRLRNWDCEISDTCNKCEGDCDGDADCKGQLRCQQNDSADHVPGCAGTSQWGRDYCYDPKDRSNGLDLRSHSQCSTLFPCDACQGDCDSDNECFGNLVCRQRISNEPVPGCTGSGSYGRDYCFDPANVQSTRATPHPTPQPTIQTTLLPQQTPAPTKSPTLKPTPQEITAPITPMPTLEPTTTPTVSPTGSPTALPTTSPTVSPTKSPTSSPTALPTSSPTSSPTNSPTVSPTITNLKPLVYFSPECDHGNPCSECEGDCDDDDECAGDLICFQRNEYTTVPGCSGSGLQNKDYCIRQNENNDSSQSNLLVTHDVDCSLNQKCGKCHGDCDNDNQCSGFLHCFQRNGYTSVPGCAGRGVAHKDYCVDPMDLPNPPLIQANRNGGNCSENNPCNICEGDCDSDRECAPELECFQRGGIAPVPGCSGEGISGKDYCYNPSIYYER